MTKKKELPWLPIMLVALGLIWLVEPFLNLNIPLIPVVLLIWGFTWLYNYYK